MKKLLILITLIIAIVGAYYIATTYMYESSVQADQKKPSDPRIMAIWVQMVGTWSNEDDRNMQREYTNSGIYVDSVGSVNGEINASGQWSVFTSDNADEVSFLLSSEEMYVKQVDENDVVSYLRVVDVTPTELELRNMESGEITRFGKMPTGFEMTDGEE